MLRWNLKFLANHFLGRRSILFECQQPRDWGFLESLYCALALRQGCRCYVLVNDRPARIGGVGFDVEVLKGVLMEAGVPAGRIAPRLNNVLYFADFYVTPTAWNNFLPADRSIVRAILPHGLVNKLYKHGQFGAEVSEFDVLLSSGPECTKTVTRFRAEQGQSYAIWPAGYPKVDRLMKMQGRTSVKPVSRAPLCVLFAPTWGKHAALDVYGLDPVQWVLDAGHQVVIKLHPMSLSENADFATGGVDWRKALERFRGHERVQIVGTTANDEVMRQADVMISDVSGIAYEFLLMGKPVVFLDVPGFFQNSASNWGADPCVDLSYWGREYGLRASSLQQMVEALATVVHGEWNPETVKPLVERLLYHPGCAGETSANMILNHFKGIDPNEARALSRDDAQLDGQP